MHGERVKSVIIASLNRAKIGDYDEKLPPHITVVPPFVHHRLLTSEIVNQVGEQLSDVEPFEIEAQEITVPAHNEGVPARRVGSKVLYIVHNRLTAAINSISQRHDVAIDTTAVFANYQPHTALEEEAVLHEEECRTVRALYLAQCAKLKGFPKSWFIAAEYKLGDNE